MGVTCNPHHAIVALWSALQREARPCSVSPFFSVAYLVESFRCFSLKFIASKSFDL